MDYHSDGKPAGSLGTPLAMLLLMQYLRLSKARKSYEIEELQGEELVKSLEEKEAWIESTFAQLMRDKLKQEWKQAEHSSRMAIEKEKKDATMRNTDTAKVFTKFFAPVQKAQIINSAPETIPKTLASSRSSVPGTIPKTLVLSSSSGVGGSANLSSFASIELEGFLSDTEDNIGDVLNLSDNECCTRKESTHSHILQHSDIQSELVTTPPRKYQRHLVPAQVERAEASARYWEKQDEILTSALKDIDKLIVSKKTNFVNGHNSLQATKPIHFIRH
ncbi:hypothetical protein F5876DRAFT_70226 [Lentinula aff. lateritia]|uniref:Uncharacterized protein n=1 Tax=Lentinula aff. lateritia TaxID=2804960 RepID=A0ACC1TK05_9AGAR|nr:hypothetical protein F5876DRAFT_70226 [Lentinula aff. lateritia]